MMATLSQMMAVHPLVKSKSTSHVHPAWLRQSANVITVVQFQSPNSTLPKSLVRMLFKSSTHFLQTIWQHGIQSTSPASPQSLPMPPLSATTPLAIRMVLFPSSSSTLQTWKAKISMWWLIRLLLAFSCYRKSMFSPAVSPSVLTTTTCLTSTLMILTNWLMQLLFSV